MWSIRGSYLVFRIASKDPLPRDLLPNPCLESLLLNPLSWIPSSESLVFNALSWIPYLESLLLNPLPWMPCLESLSWMPCLESLILNPFFWIPCLESLRLNTLLPPSLFPLPPMVFLRFSALPGCKGPSAAGRCRGGAQQICCVYAAIVHGTFATLSYNAVFWNSPQ